MPALTFLGGTVLFFGIFAIWALWGGYVLTMLWAWFIVPTFHLPPLHLAAAIGVGMIISYLTSHIDMREDKEDWPKWFAETLLASISKPLFALFFGWIVHFFM